MSHVKRILRDAASASDIVHYSLAIQNLTNEAMAKGLTETQLAIILSGYIRSIISLSWDPNLVAELSIAEIKKANPVV